MSTRPVSRTEPGRFPRGPEPTPPEEIEEDGGPRELESALLTLALFGGLVVFGIGCMVFLW